VELYYLLSVRGEVARGAINAGIIFIIAGAINITAGEIFIIAEAIYVIAGAINITAGGIFITAGAIYVIAGAINTTAGGIFISSGVINANGEGRYIVATVFFVGFTFDSEVALCPAKTQIVELYYLLSVRGEVGRLRRVANARYCCVEHIHAIGFYATIIPKLVIPTKEESPQVRHSIVFSLRNIWRRFLLCRNDNTMWTLIVELYYLLSVCGEVGRLRAGIVLFALVCGYEL
jgi:hypothetical protein